MSQMTKYDLIQLLSGANEEGVSKCAIEIKRQRQNAAGELSAVEEEFSSEKPIVQISNPAGGFIVVDLIFDSIEDLDLQIIFSMLRRYFSSAESINEKDEDYPCLFFSIVSDETMGKYWAMGINPIFYALTPDDVYGEPRIIRMTFCHVEDPDAPPPNFVFFESPDETLERYRAEDPEEY